jgi:hypothetical protein
MPIKEMVATWNFNSRHNLVWGPLGRIDGLLKTWFYRPYEINRMQRSCFGFLVEWAPIHEDPKGRPGKVLFGYLCGARGETLEDQEIRGIIRGFSVRTPDESTGAEETRSLPNNGYKETAIEAARGSGFSADSGNQNFPFLFARYYSMSRGGERP